MPARKAAIGIAADQQQVATERRAAQDESEDQRGEDRDPGDQRDGEEALDREDAQRSGMSWAERPPERATTRPRTQM